MAIYIIPKPKMVLACDFSDFKAPEMTKKRPVVIVSSSPARPNLCQVVPISRTEPGVMQAWHHPLSRASSWDRQKRWVKCDMIYTVSFARLDRWQKGKNSQGKRTYLANFSVSDADFEAIKAGISHVIGLQ